MCGIAGLLRTVGPAEMLAADARAMGDALVHRGPDDSGVWVDADAGVALSQRRLAIVDLSPAGHQPMTSADGRWTVVFNGEIYDHEDQRRTLADLGVRFRGRSDTEVLVEAIARWGIDATLARLNAMFAIAVWDAQDRRLVLARDRLGEKPLYWTAQPSGTAFGSELRALRALPWLTMDVDPLSAAALLARSYVPHPWTIHRDVHQVAPGGIVELAVGRAPVTRRWWSLVDAVEAARSRTHPPTIGGAADAVDDAIAAAVAIRMGSDVPLGAFLSGGIDSSLVASHAQRALGATRLKTFTIAMPDAGLDESAHAERVAAHLGTDHTTIAISATDALSLIPRLGSLWDEPFADPSMVPTALLAAAVRSHVTVALSGDGGDELFAGYNRHAAGATLHARMQGVPAPVRRSLARAALSVRPSTVDAAARLVPARRRPPLLGDKLHKAAALALSPDDAWESLSATWPASAVGPSHLVDRPGVGGGLDPVELMVLADTAAVLPDEMLVKVDRASMAVGLEVRVPLLDPALFDLAWSLPTAMKTSGGVGKVVLRRVADRHLPADLARRPKLGFDPPLGRWLRGELRSWAQDLLANPRCVAEGWIDGRAVRDTWRGHLAGRRNDEYRLWSVLMLESWLESQSPR